MEGLLPHMKLDHYNRYTPEDTARAESALLTVWAALGDLTADQGLAASDTRISSWSLRANTHRLAKAG